MLRKKLRISDDNPEAVVKSEESEIPIETINHTTLERSSYFQNVNTCSYKPENKTSTKSDELLLISDDLSESLSHIQFVDPVAYVYNPTVYARDLYSQYVTRYGNTSREVLFLGMNPGPLGMCQTGVPFGNVSTVSEWLQLSGTVEEPEDLCPSRPIQGLAFIKEEVSGKRFWDLFRNLCQVPTAFFKHAYVYNYCPIALFSAEGKNFTPEEVKKQKEQKQQLEEACGTALVRIVRALDVKVVVAIGRYAAQKAERVLLKDVNVTVLRLAHPSPRSPQSRNWSATATNFLRENNLIHYFTSSPQIK